MGESGAFCKHAVALGLGWHARAMERTDPGVRTASLLIGFPAFVLRDGRLSTEELPGFEALP